VLPVTKLVSLGLVLPLIVFLGCSSADDPPGENVDQIEAAVLAGRRVDPAEVAGALRQAGLPEATVGQLVCTAKYESSFYERASNHNSNGTDDYGVLQVNSVHIGDAGCPSTADGLYDASANVRCAVTIYKSQGMGAWVAYKKHRSECDHYAAPPSPAAKTAAGNGSNNGGSSGSTTSPGGTASKADAGAGAGADAGGKVITGPCNHDVCTAGERLGQQCDACTMKVCAVDTYCCDTYWGVSCFDRVKELCGKTCP
jgi:hypothetical protein